MKKQYVNYVALIGLYGLERDFNMYCKKHRGLSIRRNARNFLLNVGKYEELKHWRTVGFSGSFEDLCRIAQEKWL